MIKAESALRRATIDREFDDIRKLILDGLDINIVLEDGVTLLMEAVHSEDIELVKELVNLGADVNIQQAGGYTALWLSASYGCEEIFNFLAPLTLPDIYEEAEAELSQGIIRRQRRDNILLDRLTTAVIYCNRESILETIRDGCDINAINEDGRTVLFIASLWGYYDIVKLLVDNGADINFRSEDGNDTPLTAALSGVGTIGHNTSLSKNTTCQHILVLRLLLSAGANVNAKTTEGWSALLAAINYQSVEAVKLLIDYGADVSTRYREHTALSFARERGDAEIVQFLINAGAV